MSSNKPLIIILIVLIVILLGLAGLFIFFPPGSLSDNTTPTADQINQPVGQVQEEDGGFMAMMKKGLAMLPFVGDEEEQTEVNNQNEIQVPTKQNNNQAAPESPNNELLAMQAGSAGVADPNARLSPAPLGFNGALPPARVPFTDPTFGTTILRFTDATDRNDFATHDYSQLQAFSIGNNYLLVSEEGGVTPRRLSDGALSPLGSFNNKNTVRWWPGRADTLFFFDSNEDETLIAQSANVRTGEMVDVFSFPPNYQRIRVNQSFDELSDDGRWVAGMAQMADDDDVIFALDLNNNRLAAEISLRDLYSGTCVEDPEFGIIEPDWVGPSPLGNYLVVNWPRDGVERCSGQEVFDISSGQYIGHSYESRQHGDLAVTADGREVFITSTSGLDNTDGLPAIVSYSLPNGAENPEVIRVVPWHAVWHISCRGPRGMCAVTSFDADVNSDFPGVVENEIYLVYFDGSLRRLAHHRSSGCGYWVQPRATISLDGRYIAFDSDFQVETGGRDSCDRLNDSLGGGEVFLIVLPEEALQTPNRPTPINLNLGNNTAENNNAQNNAVGQEAQNSEPTVELGKNGPLPTTSRTLQGNEFVDFGEANPPYTLLLEHDIGNPAGETCSDRDFIEYDFYTAEPGSEVFTHVGNHSEIPGPFINGHALETQGCAKGTFLYTLAPGNYRAAVCITNIENTAERYCTNPIDITSS